MLNGLDFEASALRKKSGFQIVSIQSVNDESGAKDSTEPEAPQTNGRAQHSASSSGSVPQDTEGTSRDPTPPRTEPKAAAEPDKSALQVSFDLSSVLQEESSSSEQEEGENQSRFRVVKVENKEPFRRSRWACRDMQDEEEDAWAEEEEAERRQSLGALEQEALGALADPQAQTASSSSVAVNISNKIEAAMDLVKSHLMFAVKEEIEVMKEEIRELRIRSLILEHENRIYRAAATKQTLQEVELRRQLLRRFQETQARNTQEASVETRALSQLLGGESSLSQALASGTSRARLKSTTSSSSSSDSEDAAASERDPRAPTHTSVPATDITPTTAEASVSEVATGPDTSVAEIVNPSDGAESCGAKPEGTARLTSVEEADLAPRAKALSVD